MLHLYYRVCNIVAANDPLMPYRIPDKTAHDILEASSNSSSSSSSSCAEVEEEPSKCSSVLTDELNPPLAKFSFAAGDFVELYGQPRHAASWDGVVTCFFLDTAPVVLK